MDMNNSYNYPQNDHNNQITLYHHQTTPENSNIPPNCEQPTAMYEQPRENGALMPFVGQCFYQQPQEQAQQHMETGTYSNNNYQQQIMNQINNTKFHLNNVETEIASLISQQQNKQDSASIGFLLHRRIEESKALHEQISLLYNKIPGVDFSYTTTPSSSLVKITNLTPMVMSESPMSAMSQSQQCDRASESHNSLQQFQQCPLQNEQFLLQDIAQKLEKIEYEMNSWKEEARLYSIGPIEAQQIHFMQLKSKIIPGIGPLEESLTTIGMRNFELLPMQNATEMVENNVLTATSLFTKFLHFLPIVRQQPPVFTVSYKNQGSKYWFDLSIELLCKDLLKMGGFEFKASCELVDGKSAKKQFCVADEQLREDVDTSTEVKPIIMHVDNYKAEAKNLSILMLESGTRKLDEHAYKIRFFLELTSAHCSIKEELFSHEIDIHTNKPDEELVQTALRKRLFNDPVTVHPKLMMIAIEMLFQWKLKSIASSNSAIAYEYVQLSERAKKFLLRRITNNNKNYINVESFVLVDDLFEEYVFFTLLEWLYGVAKILCVNKTVYEMWTKGLIYGFCSREESDLHVRCCRDAVLIRFANFEYSREHAASAFSVDVRTNNGTVLNSIMSLETFTNSNDQHFALICRGTKLFVENKHARSAGYFGSKYRIVRWMVDCVRRLTFTHVVEQQETVDLGTTAYGTRNGVANGSKSSLKRAKTPKCPNGKKKSKQITQAQHPIGPNETSDEQFCSSSQHPNDPNQNCQLFVPYQTMNAPREGDAIIEKFMDLKFIVEATGFKEVEGIEPVNVHFFQ